LASVYNDTVTIDAERRQENDADEQCKWLYRERSVGTISRTIGPGSWADLFRNECALAHRAIPLHLAKIGAASIAVR
jgi:hypothetical protein